MTKTRRNHSLPLFTAALATLALVGCDQVPVDSSTGNETGTSSTTDVQSSTGEATRTRLVGMVLDPDGFPIANTTITASTGQTATTSSVGAWSMDDLSESGRIGLEFQADGYARHHEPVKIAADTTNARYTTLAPIDHEGAFQPRNGVSFSIEDGPEVELPSDAYVDTDGNPYDGEIHFEATHYDVAYKSGQYMTEESGSERAAAPGDYSAVDTEGEDQLLESFGMFQLDLFGEDGEELELDGETSAQFTMPLSDSSTTIGETIPAWHYDTEAMTWVEEGEGEVVELADGTVAWQFEAPHFSTWNADQPIRTWGCVTCPAGIRDFDGRPLKGVQAQVDGVDFNSSTADSSDDDGGFCIVTKNDSTVDFSMTYAIGGTAYQETERLILPPGQATCDEISACVRPESCTLDIPL